MIWFTCKQCGKTHGRAETSIGTLIFCECGEGNLVPWESTTAEPPQQPAEPPPPPPDVPAPKLEPLTFEPPAGARDKPYDVLPPARTPRSRVRRRVRTDPNVCLNHSATPKKETCADCQEAFCVECLVTFQGETLCGPCKNFRIHALDTPPRLSTFALISVGLALVTGPLPICLVLLGRSSGPYLILPALVPQLAALVLGILALRQTEQSPRVTGWSLALTGLLTASVGSMLTILLAVFGARLAV